MKKTFCDFCKLDLSLVARWDSYSIYHSTMQGSNLGHNIPNVKLDLCVRCNVKVEKAIANE